MIEVANALGHAVARAAGFRSHFVETPGGRVHVLEQQDASPGRLPPLLVLHGIGAGSAGYAMVLRRLSGRFSRVIVPDLPGHGKSDVPAGGLAPDTLHASALAMFDALVDRPVVVFGNSMGGLAAVRIAAARPDRVAGLLLSSPGGAWQPTDEIQSFLNRFRADDAASARDFVRRLYAEPPWYTPWFAPGVRRLFGQPHMRAFMASIREEHLLRADEIRAIHQPLRLVWGKRDQLLLPEHRDFWLASAPAHADVAEPDDFGHCPYLDRPNQLADEIISFSQRFR